MIADADPAIHNGFLKVFGDNCRIIMCYAHVVRNIATRYTFASQENRDPLLNDIRVLHNAYDEYIFDIGCRLFIAKWSKKEPKVTSLIKKSFMDKNKFWFIGAYRAVPKDNNKQERFHRDLKLTHTCYKRKPLKKFIRNAFQIIGDISTGYDYGDNAPFNNQIDVSTDLLRKGLDYKNRFAFGEKNDDNSLDFFVFSSTANNDDQITMDHVEEFQNAHETYETFDEFTVKAFLIWKMSFPAKIND